MKLQKKNKHYRSVRVRKATWMVCGELMPWTRMIFYTRTKQLENNKCASYLSGGAISICSRHITLSMDVCKLHSNTLTTSATTSSGEKGVHCAFSVILAGGGGEGGSWKQECVGTIIRVSPLFLLFFPSFFSIEHPW